MHSIQPHKSQVRKPGLWGATAAPLKQLLSDSFLLFFSFRSSQGEPLYNYRNMRTALRLLLDEEGLAISRRRIIVSTSGIVARHLPPPPPPRPHWVGRVRPVLLCAALARHPFCL